MPQARNIPARKGELRGHHIHSRDLVTNWEYRVPKTYVLKVDSGRARDSVNQNINISIHFFQHNGHTTLASVRHHHLRPLDAKGATGFLLGRSAKPILSFVFAA